MTRLLSLLLLASLAAMSSGCAMCNDCLDEEYGFFGGSWQRGDMAHGRVGSAFYEAGGTVLAPDEPEVIAAPTKPKPSETLNEEMDDESLPAEEMESPDNSEPGDAYSEDMTEETAIKIIPPRPLKRAAPSRTPQRNYLP